MKNLRTFFLMAVIMVGLGFMQPAWAATGGIVAGQQYSQFIDADIDNDSTTDFINWLPRCGATAPANNCPNPVTISDAIVTGDIWGETVGWIRLDPNSTGIVPPVGVCDGKIGVFNTAAGELSGCAWGENAGWINFSTANAIIDPQIDITTGEITGQVWSENYGWIELASPDGGHPGVVTAWRPGTGGGGGGGGGGSSGGGSVGPGPQNPQPTPTPTPVYPIFPTPTPTPIFPAPITPSNPSIPGTGPGSSSGGIIPLLPIPGATVPTDSVMGKIANWFDHIEETPMMVILPLLGAIGFLGTVPGLVLRFINVALLTAFVRRKARGVVFDAKNKQPLDPAYISVLNEQGVEVATQITDMEGRYGFVLNPGTYRIVANKTHYQFPSTMLAGKSADEVYDHLYYGEPFTIINGDDVTTMNIPMDPVGTDWNQVEKRRMNPWRYLVENQATVAKIFRALFVIGFAASIIITYFYPVWWNLVLTVVYIIIAVLQTYGFGPISAGTITRAGRPIPGAIVHVSSPTLGREVAKKVANDHGAYYLLVPKGDYTVTVDEPRPDGTYMPVTTETLRASHGMINKSFEV